MTNAHLSTFDTSQSIYRRPLPGGGDLLIVLIVAIVEHGDAFGDYDIDDDIDEVDNDRRYLGGPG